MRPRRIIFYGFTALSLVLCIAAAAMWIRSYWSIDEVVWVPTEKSQFGYGFSTCLGTLDLEKISIHYWEDNYLEHSNERLNIHPRKIRSFNRFVHSDWFKEHSWYGFAWEKGSDMHGHEAYFAYVPFWFVTMITALLPGFTLFKAIRRRRPYAKGCCAACGYDLRATPDHCPECGAVPSGP